MKKSKPKIRKTVKKAPTKVPSRSKKAAAKTTAAKAAKAKPMSGLDAAAKVLAESAEPLGVRGIVEVAFEKGFWKSSGRTPHATIYSAMIREIAKKGDESRFKKTDRGKFAANR